jgi:hypothetical protein
MSALSIQVPFPVFQDRDGQPLDNGYVWIGEANLNPQTNPVVVYFDEALTITAAQPLRTINGYVSRSGSPAQIYVDGVNFSILVQDSKGSLVYNFPDGTGISASLPASAITYDPPGAFAVPTNVEAKLSEYVSVKDFGAIGDGAVDDTTAINNALLSVNALGKVALYFPAGIYRYQGGGWLGNGVVITGAGRDATTIRSITASPTNGYLFECRGYGSGIRSMRFDALGTTQTGGSYVRLQGPESFIEDFHITNDFNGILMVGSVSRIRHGRFQDGATNAIRIRAEGGDNSQLIDDVLMGAQSPQVSSAGIRVRNSSALIISNTSVIQQGNALLVDPTTATQGANTADGSVFSLYVNNCFFDNSSGNGIRIAATGTGSVVRCRFANCWASSSTEDGVFIVNAGTGIVSGIHFESPHLMLNGDSGMALGGTLSDIVINGGEICQNEFGIFINDTVTDLRVMGATIGEGAGLLGNTFAGIGFDAGASASDYIVIANNVMIGNGTAIFDLPLAVENISIYGNLGQDPAIWTPAITFSNPGNVAVTYSTRSGNYIRTGNTVAATFEIVTSSFTYTTATGDLYITGLPFTSSAQVQSFSGDLEFQGITKAGYTNYTLNIEENALFIRIRASGSGVPILTVGTGDVPTGGSVIFRGSITYFV